MGHDLGWWLISAIMWWCHCTWVLLWPCCCISLSHPRGAYYWAVMLTIFSFPPNLVPLLLNLSINSLFQGGLHRLCRVWRLALGLRVFPKERPWQGQGRTHQRSKGETHFKRKSWNLTNMENFWDFLPHRACVWTGQLLRLTSMQLLWPQWTTTTGTGSTRQLS